MTQTESVLKHLKSGKSLTARQARRLYGVDRLAARIYDVRTILSKRPGLDRWLKPEDIRTDIITVHTRNGKARVAKYSLVR